MPYVDEFIVPVPKKNLQAYRRLAQKAGKIWRKGGVWRMTGIVVVAIVVAACRMEAKLPESLAREVATCDKGDMTSCENAAGAFENGIGVDRDPKRAAALRERLLKLARDYCDDGKAHGCSYLGRVYFEGIGVQADRDRGVALLRRGCAGRDALACTYLENAGIPRAASAGVGPEPARARSSFEEMAERKIEEAERRLKEQLRDRPK